MKNIITHTVVPMLVITGFRFSKDYRHGITRFNRIVYFMINTPQANILADKIKNLMT